MIILKSLLFDNPLHEKVEQEGDHVEEDGDFVDREVCVLNPVKALRDDAVDGLHGLVEP